MTLIRKQHETQRAFVERVLREDGSISAYDVLYDARFEDGGRTSVTRLAAVIFDLRKAGWSIDERASHGSLATYSLSEVKEPAWRRGWHCQTCGSLPATEPVEKLAGFAEAHCPVCARRTYFRRSAAA